MDHSKRLRKSDQNVERSSSYLSAMGRTSQAIALMVLTVLLLLATAYRIQRTRQTPGPFNPAAQGYCDFHNGVYFPSKAFLHRVSPYSQRYAEDFPVARSTPFFSPVAFAAHVPWALLPLPVAEVLYFGWMILLVLAISRMVTLWVQQFMARAPHDPGESLPMRWDIFGWIAAALVASRGGHQTFYTGYFTFELILASLVAVQYGKNRPWLSALALVIVSFKPNYVLPIGILMLVRGNTKAVVLGGILSACLAMLCFAWIAPEEGLQGLIAQIESTQRIHASDEVERPVNSWLRVDLLAVIAKWVEFDPSGIQYVAVMTLMLLPIAILLILYRHTHSDDDGSTVSLSGGLLMLTALISIYHHVYDTLLMNAFVAGLIYTNRSVRNPLLRYGIATGLLIPNFNYFSSQRFLELVEVEGRIHQLLTSINGVVLVITWVLLAACLAAEIYKKRTQSSKRYSGTDL